MRERARSRSAKSSSWRTSAPARPWSTTAGWASSSGRSDSLARPHPQSSGGGDGHRYDAIWRIEQAKLIAVLARIVRGTHSSPHSNTGPSQSIREKVRRRTGRRPTTSIPDLYGCRYGLASSPVADLQTECACFNGHEVGRPHGRKAPRRHRSASRPREDQGRQYQTSPSRWTISTRPISVSSPQDRRSNTVPQASRGG